MGVTVDAIRKRVQRGTIPHERDESGRVWVLLDATRTMQDESSNVQDKGQDDTGRYGRELLEAKEETIEELRGRVHRLEQDLDARTEELRRRDHLLAAALERIPAIEPPETPESPQAAAESPEGTSAGTSAGEREAESSRPEERRSWWQRLFGAE